MIGDQYIHHSQCHIILTNYPFCVETQKKKQHWRFFSYNNWAQLLTCQIWLIPFYARCATCIQDKWYRHQNPQVFHGWDLMEPTEGRQDTIPHHLWKSLYLPRNPPINTQVSPSTLVPTDTQFGLAIVYGGNGWTDLCCIVGTLADHILVWWQFQIKPNHSQDNVFANIPDILNSTWMIK